jgi:Rrf2 family protein
MCALAGARGDSLQAKAIATRADVPLKFLEAILVDLRVGGFVRSTRGKAGGHALARPADDIVVGDLIRAIDGPLAPVRCASVTAYAPCADCKDPESCAVRGLMREAREALASVLDTCTLQTLHDRAHPIAEVETPP